MTAKEFIVETYPVTAKDFENKECVGLHDIAYICEKYHESKVKNLGLFSVIQQRELLKKFLDWGDGKWFTGTPRNEDYEKLLDEFFNCS